MRAGCSQDGQADRDQPQMMMTLGVEEVGTDELSVARSDGKGEDRGGIRGHPRGKFLVDDDDAALDRRCCYGVPSGNSIRIRQRRRFCVSYWHNANQTS